MDIVVHGMNVALSDRTKEYAEKKLQKLDRYLPNIIEARIEFRNEKNKNKERPIAQLTVRNNKGVIFRSEDDRQQDLHAAVDVVVDKMYRQIQRYKGKTQRKKGTEKWLEGEAEWQTVEEVPLEAATQAPADDDKDYDELKRDVVVRRKTVLLTPMSEQEAMDQMELLGHDWFVFYNGEEDTINVMYRRKGGDLGILTPRFD
jgi:putative sigma-54 modulation protein